MAKSFTIVVALLASLVFSLTHSDGDREERAVREKEYRWKQSADPADALDRRIPPPAGFVRTDVDKQSFEAWLRALPLKKGNPPVFLHDGRKKANQDIHAAVVEIDVGERDLQQCADAVIRLRAEYLFSRRRHDKIHFNFTSGDRAEYLQWAKGFRPVVKGNSVRWVQSAGKDDSYANFRKYLDTVFAYAGTASLSKEMARVEGDASLRIGDVFIQGGSPGHAVIVVDLAEDPATRKKVFLIAQSYMPAQDVHILKNPGDGALSPWYPVDFGDRLVTPEWTFLASDLKRFE